MSGGSGGSQSTTPWGGQQPYLTNVFEQARDQYGDEASRAWNNYYPGQTVAGLDPATLAAMTTSARQAMNPAPYRGAMENYLTGAMNQNPIDMTYGQARAMMSTQGVPQSMDMLARGGVNPYASLDAAQQFALGGSQPYSQALQGMTAYGGLGGASQFAGAPVMSGPLNASNQYVQDALAQSPTLQQSIGDISAATGQGSLQQSIGDINSMVGQGSLQQSIGDINSMVGQGSLQQSIGDVSGALDPAAQAQLSSTAQGDYLGSNPYLDQMFNSAARGVTDRFNETVMPGIAAQFGAGGRTGSGAHALSAGRAAGELSDSLTGMAADIYAPAYEAERGRQLQAAGQLGDYGLGAAGLGADVYGQDQARQLQAAGLGADVYGQDQARQLQAAGLGADVYGQDQARQLQAAGLGADVYGQEQSRRLAAAGLGGDLYGTANQTDLARRGLASDMYLGERGLAQSAALGGMGATLQGNQLAGDLFGSGQQNQLTAGGLLGDLGMGGISAMTDMYGAVDNSRFRAATQAPVAQSMSVADIESLYRAGAVNEAQAQRMMDDAMMRYNYERDRPAMALQQYSNLINQMPGGYGTTTTTPSQGSRAAGLAGGAATGYAMMGGPANPYAWIGALGGALYGGLS